LKIPLPLTPLALHLEALIFATEHPVRLAELRDCLEEVFEAAVAESELTEALAALSERYKSDDFAFELVEIDQGWQFLTKSSHHRVLSVLLKQRTKKRLSQASMETLSIVAYKQPVSKADVERVRGVNSDYALQKLLEKELIAPVGRSEGPGRPLLYGTTAKFMDYLGLKDLADLPKLRDFTAVEHEIGQAPPGEEEHSLEHLP
jgi:segregation and condensation protein B